MMEFPAIDVSVIENDDRHRRFTWLRDVALVSRTCLDEGVDIQTWMREFQSLREHVLRQVWEATIPVDVRAKLVYIRFGSAGRREDLLTSDLDHGIILKEEFDIVDLMPTLQRFIGRMSDFGWPVCQGFVMGTNPRWIGTAERWRQRMEGYFQLPDWENVRYLFIALDGSPLDADTEIWQPLRDYVFDGIRNSPFICWEMAHLGIHKSVALDVFGRIRTRNGGTGDGFHIKDGLITPILHALRLLAVADGFPVNSTWERLRHIENRGLLPTGLLQRTTAALKYGITVRLHKQIEDVLQGREPSDVLPLQQKALAPDNATILLAHLETAKQLERFTHRTFRKPR